MTEVIPALMPKNLDELRDKLSVVRDLTSYVQIDVMDGIFVPNFSFPYVTRGKLKIESDELPYWQDFNFEFDLMIKNPEHVIGAFLSLGAQRIILHLEGMEESMIEGTILEIKNFEAEVGISVGNDTPISSLEKYIGSVDFVQVMGISKIGFQGEPFDKRAIDRVKFLREKYPELIISVDGAVDKETAKDLVEAGVNRLVSGSYIYQSGDAKSAIAELSSISASI